MQHHGLDCPKYYTKLYNLIAAQTVPTLYGNGVKSIFAMESDTKQRFLRLLDLSLRAPTLPSKLIASFIKRLARQCINFQVTEPSDTLFCLSLILNLTKRHPRTIRLITRSKNSLSLGLTLTDDPFTANESDPLKTKALRSSLWEVEILMRQHYDSRIRDFCKLFKTDLKAKTNVVKPESFLGASKLMKDLEDIDVVKEGSLVSKNILKRNGIDNSKLTLGKRTAEPVANMYEPMGRKVKLGERFET